MKPKVCYFTGYWQLLLQTHNSQLYLQPHISPKLIPCHKFNPWLWLLGVQPPRVWGLMGHQLLPTLGSPLFLSLFPKSHGHHEPALPRGTVPPPWAITQMLPDARQGRSYRPWGGRGDGPRSDPEPLDQQAESLGLNWTLWLLIASGWIMPRARVTSVK